MLEYEIELLNWKSDIAEQVEELRIFYFLRGGGDVLLSGRTFRAGKNDIFLVNHQETCRISMDQNVMAAVLTVDYYQMCRTLETDELRFSLNSCLSGSSSCRKIAADMQKLLLAWSEQRGGHTYRERAAFYMVLDILQEKFLAKESLATGRSECSRRAMHMISYIRQNYRNEISLREVAAEIGLSTSAASRLFLRETGEHFAVYTNSVRLQHFVKDLLHTDFPVTKIGLDSGFSSPSVLNRVFRERYQMSPSEYRRRNALQSGEERKEIQQNFREAIKEAGGGSRLVGNERTLVEADVRQSRPNRKRRIEILNGGTFYHLRSAGMQRQMTEIADRLRVRYLRMWSPFSKQMMVLGDKGTYNFSFLDEILDFCVDHHLKPFIDMGQRTDAALANERMSIYDYSSVIPFSSEIVWLELVRSFVAHCVQRYGKEEVLGWVFEITLFLNAEPYYQTDRYSISGAYAKTFRAIRQALPGAVIAGPGLPGDGDAELVEALVKQFLDANCTPDIFTCICFPYDKIGGDTQVIHVGKQSFHRIEDSDFFTKEIDILKEALRKYEFTGKLIVTELGFSIANRNYMQDSVYRGCFLLQNVLRNYEKVDDIGIFYASDLLNVFSDTREVLSGSGGIVSRSGIPKPAFYAFEFLNTMGRLKLKQTDSCIVTAETENEIHILCFSCQNPGTEYYLAEENCYRPGDIPDLFPEGEAHKMRFDLHLPGDDDQYLVQQRILNKENGSALNKWIQFGCEKELPRSVVNYLRQVAVPTIQIRRMQAKKGKLNFSVELQPNEMREIMIRRV